MTDPKGATKSGNTGGSFSLRRWSQRKREAARAATEPQPVRSPVDAAMPGTVAAGATTETASRAPASEPLPDVESLTPASDFAPFMKSDVDPAVKRSALKKLFTDPRYNVMDGLDTYVDDYSKSDPIPPGIAATLAQARYLLDPPVTRVDENGCVVDVPSPVPADVQPPVVAEDSGIVLASTSDPGQTPVEKREGQGEDGGDAADLTKPGPRQR